MLPLNAVFAQQETAAPNTQEQATLKNQDVIEMLKHGLSPEIIVAKIKASACNFETTPAALQELKSASVPDDVIMAMVQAPVGAPAAAVATSNATLVEVKIPDGTQLEVELMSTISSATAKEGDIIDFTVVSPLVVNGVTVIEKGAPAKARVAGVKKAGYWGKAGKIGWIMQDVTMVDGTRAPLRMEKKLTGDSKGGTVATATVVTAVVFWPAAPFWGLKKGKNAVYPAGKRFESFVQGDVSAKGRPSTGTPQTSLATEIKETQSGSKP
ncbi:MAG: hypothetical protein JO360_06860 [Acidobacteria bacterium]|nr:hypothetical protein [Acidobacteriota bacterium]